MEGVEFFFSRRDVPFELGFEDLARYDNFDELFLIFLRM